MALKATDLNPTEMANAPLNHKPQTDAAPVNRFSKLFTAVIFKPAGNDTVYTAERSGLRSKRLASVSVEVAGTGGYIPGSIYARQPRNAPKAVAEFGFSGTMYQPGFYTEDRAAKDELDAWRKEVADQYIAWAAKTGSVATATVNVGADLGISL